MSGADRARTRSRSGGGSVTPVASAPTPVPLPTFAPFVVSTSAPVPAATSVTLAAPAAPVAVSVGLQASSGAIAAGTTVNETVSNSAPSGLPVLDVAHRTDAATRAAVAGAITPIAYLQMAFSPTVTLTSAPSFTLIAPNGYVLPSGASYYIALYDPLRPSLGWQTGFEGPTVNGQTLTFAALFGQLHVRRIQTYTFTLYATSASASTPTPAPSIALNTPSPCRLHAVADARRHRRRHRRPHRRPHRHPP